MPKNTEGKEADTFEQEMEAFIRNLVVRCRDAPDDHHSVGQLFAYKYALAIYRECREDGTI